MAAAPTRLHLAIRQLTCFYAEDWLPAFYKRGGESFYDMYARVEQGVHQILDTSGVDDTLLIVSHGGPMRVLATILLDLPKEIYWHLVAGQGSYCLLPAYPQKPLWFSIAEWNSVRVRDKA